jgi:hypothetical protein
MARKKMNRVYDALNDCCCDGCNCKACESKSLGGTGVESGLSSRESLGKANAGTVKSHDLVEGSWESDKTGNDVGGVF